MLIFVFLFWLCVNLYMVLGTKKYVFSSASAVPERYTAIVLGARVYQNGMVSHVFRDRIDGGVSLLTAGTVQKVLVSGDHGKKSYDEVNAALHYISLMYALDENLIFLDHAGFSTYETMYRARDVFCVHDAVIVTQRFHAYRAVYIARHLGLDVVAYVPPAKNAFSLRTRCSWQVRESFARVKAFLSVAFRAKPRFLGERIPITGDATPTRDE